NGGWRPLVCAPRRRGGFCAPSGLQKRPTRPPHPKARPHHSACCPHTKISGTPQARDGRKQRRLGGVRVWGALRGERPRWGGVGGGGGGGTAVGVGGSSGNWAVEFPASRLRQSS